MKVTVIGAAGKSGRVVVEQALAAGHDVTAFVHNYCCALPVTVRSRRHWGCIGGWYDGPWRVRFRQSGKLAARNKPRLGPVMGFIDFNQIRGLMGRF